MYFSPLKTAFVFKESVSDPLFGSVTPKACNLKSPEAIFGRKFDFCFSLPCLKMVPIVYIWAWHAAAFPPDLWISSRITAPADKGRPAPPYFSGIKDAKKPEIVNSLTNSVG